MVTHDLTRPGLVIIGDAAGFTLNMGLTIRGMDLTADSVLAAVGVIEKAFQTMDFGRQSMDQYHALLDESFVGKDMATCAKTPAFLEHPHMYKGYGRLVAEVFHDIFDHDLTSRRHIRKAGPDALRASDLKPMWVVDDILTGIRTL